MANSTRSPLGEPRAPRVPKQGSMASSKADTVPPRNDGAIPGGFHKPTPRLGQEQRNLGYRPNPQGGKGDGSHRGDRLPR